LWSAKRRWAGLKALGLIGAVSGLGSSIAGCAGSSTAGAVAAPSGVKVLVLAVIVGIGSTLFSHFTAGFGGNQPTIDNAMALMLGALSPLGLESPAVDQSDAKIYAAFLVFFWLGALTLLAGYHVLDPVAKFCLTMAIVYGIADVAEDFWLVRLFSRGAKITKPEGALACLLTQTKLLAISLTLVGGLPALGKIFANARGS
jgi:hypothetical protein